MLKSTKLLIKELRGLLGRLFDFIPEHSAIDWETSRAAMWANTPIGGYFIAHSDLDDIELEDLLWIDDQKAGIDLNTRQFLQNFPANNVLLWGARGTGKSSLIHALLNRYHESGLRLVEVNKSLLVALPEIVLRLRDEPYRFILFCDDLSFEADDASYKVLKSALEGSVFKASSNVVIYATSNRRHLLPEYMTDNEQSSMVDGELHQSEAVEEKISLSDRFGLWFSFYPFRQESYLDVTEHWVNKLSERYGIESAFDEEVRGEALRWALARGVRSGRTAQHFARHWVGRFLVKSH